MPCILLQLFWEGALWLCKSNERNPSFTISPFLLGRSLPALSIHPSHPFFFIQSHVSLCLFFPLHFSAQHTLPPTFCICNQTGLYHTIVSVCLCFRSALRGGWSVGLFIHCPMFAITTPSRTSTSVVLRCKKEPKVTKYVLFQVLWYMQLHKRVLTHALSVVTSAKIHFESEFWGFNLSWLKNTSHLSLSIFYLNVANTSWCSLLLPITEVTVAFGQEQMFSDGTRLSWAVLTLNHDTLQSMVWQWLVKLLLVCFWPPAALLLRTLLSLLPTLLANFEPSSSFHWHKKQSGSAKQKLQRSFCNQPQLGLAMLAILCVSFRAPELDFFILICLLTTCLPRCCKFYQDHLLVFWGP